MEHLPQRFFQLFPSVRWIPRLEHLGKHAVSIVCTFIGAFAGFVVNPCVHDGAAGGVVAEEEAVLLEEFGTKPMFVGGAECGALAVFFAARVLRDDVKHERFNGGEALGGIFLFVVFGMFGLELFYLLAQAFQLLGKQGVKVKLPAVGCFRRCMQWLDRRCRPGAGFNRHRWAVLRSGQISRRA